MHDLPVGTFTLTLSSQGFSPLSVKGVHVVAGVTTQLGVEKLTVGATSSVIVESTSPVLETAQAQVTTSFESRAIQDLPLNTNFDNLALLAPGVVQTHDAQFSNSNGVGISANGQRGRSNNFEIDGRITTTITSPGRRYSSGTRMRCLKSRSSRITSVLSTAATWARW